VSVFSTQTKELHIEKDLKVQLNSAFFNHSPNQATKSLFLFGFALANVIPHTFLCKIEDLFNETFCGNFGKYICGLFLNNFKKIITRLATSMVARGL